MPETGTTPTWERRRLNEEIENALIIASQAASNLEMKLFGGKGAVFGDLLDFHLQFNYIFRLTRQLIEMDFKKEGDTIDKAKLKVKSWLTRKVNTNASPQELEVIIKNGLDAFDEYYYTLMHQGVITMPTKK
jgi:hypothetical protein